MAQRSVIESVAISPPMDSTGVTLSAPADLRRVRRQPGVVRGRRGLDHRDAAAAPDFRCHLLLSGREPALPGRKPESCDGPEARRRSTHSQRLGHRTDLQAGRASAEFRIWGRFLQPSIPSKCDEQASRSGGRRAATVLSALPTTGPRRPLTIPEHPQSAYGLLPVPRNRLSWVQTCIALLQNILYVKCSQCTVQ
jgi:hypothetical protein